MEIKAIKNYEQLSARIIILKSERLRQEQILKYSVHEFISSLNPISIVKKSLRGFATDKDVQIDIAKVGLNLGANLLINKVLGKQGSIKGFLSSLVLQKLSSAFIKNNESKIMSTINILLNESRR